MTNGEFIGGHVDPADAATLRGLSQHNERSLAAELRLSIRDHIRAAARDDEPAATGSIVTIAPAGRGPTLEPTD